MQTHRSCEEQDPSSAQFCQMYLNDRCTVTSVPKESHSLFQPIFTATHIYLIFSYYIIYYHYLVWSSCSVWISRHKGRGQHLKEEPFSSQRRWQHEDRRQSTWQWQGVGSAAAMLASGPNLQCFEQPQLSEKPNSALHSSWMAAASLCAQSLVIPDITLVPKTPIMKGCKARYSLPADCNFLPIDCNKRKVKSLHSPAAPIQTFCGQREIRSKVASSSC